MTESPDQLTVRVVLKPTPAAPPSSSGGYRWDRIVGAAIVAGALLVLSIWMYSGPDTKSIDPADQLVDTGELPGEPGPIVAPVPDLAPEPKLQPKSEPGPEPKPSHAEPALQLEPRPEQAENPDGLAPGPAQTVDVEPVATDLEVAVIPEQLEPEAASVDSVVETAQPRQSAMVSQAPGDSDTADGSVLRSPPVTAISTRILSPQVKRFLITDAVASREPVGDASAIREDKKVKGLVKVIAYSEVNGRAGDTLRYLWLRRDKVVASVPVRVGSDSWRSYTSKFLNVDMRGHWWVELQTSDGELLAVTEFEY